MRSEIYKGTREIRWRRGAACMTLIAISLGSLSATAQNAIDTPQYESAYAYPLTVDRGAAGLWQSLKKLQTRASLMMVVAHPDDEDGGMLAYEGRGQGVDTTLFTLNRGEGGQNVMTSDYWDEMGILRTQELLAAGNYYGVHQYFSRVADFGFSKALDEALKTWGHDRVLYDAVRIVRLVRPLVVTSVFAGNVSDGHGHHQTAGLMAQEVYNAAGDPKIFPDQIKAGLRPWSPLKVYARVPFARVTEKGIYDYATGHWEPVRFRNYVTGTWIEGVPKPTVEIPEGEYNPLFGRSYLQVAREGLNEQKSQNGGIGVPPSRPFSSPYHLYASRVQTTLPGHEADFFEGIDTSLKGIADFAPVGSRDPWKVRLASLNATVSDAVNAYDATAPTKTAPALAKGLAETRKLIADVSTSKLSGDARYNMLHELRVKERQFNDALGQALGVQVLATAQPGKEALRSGPMGDMSVAGGTSQTVIAGQAIYVNVHVADQGAQSIGVDRVKVVADGMGESADAWKFAAEKSREHALQAGDATDVLFAGTVPEDAPVTKPYYSRPNLEQSYYDILNEKDLGLPTSPYPLSAQVLYSFAGVQAEVSGVVQTTHRVNGGGSVLEPLLVAPAISVALNPSAGIVPLDNTALHLQVTVHSSVKGAAKGTVKLKLPAGWSSTPQVAVFATSRDGEEQNLPFDVVTKGVAAKPYTVSAVATYGGKDFTEGFTTIGYMGLRPYPMYRPAVYRTTGVDVKVAPGLNVAYIMGTGDDVPMSLEDIGVHVTQLSAQDVATADLSGYDAVLLGIRAYAARAELRTFNDRLLEYVKRGGVVVTQYQTAEFDRNYGPYPLAIGAENERVIEEDAKVTLLAPKDPVFSWPNVIGPKDFDGWVEERGHGFLHSFDPKYIALTEMHDKDQEPQKGGLVYAPYGKGYYVYVAFAFFRQMPDGVPGSFRIMANLLSLGKNPDLKRTAAH